VLTYASWRPVHQRCLEHERLMVARVCRTILRFARPDSVLSFHVDAVYLRSACPRLKEASRA